MVIAVIADKLMMKQICKITQMGQLMFKLDLAFNNVKPKDWYFVHD